MDKSITLLVLLTIIHSSYAILVGNTTESPQKSEAKEQNEAGKELDTNSSFYYEADSYLLNDPKSKPRTENIIKESTHPLDTSAKNESDVRPASISMTSGRNGRMLDLDALVGDFAASKANKDRNLSGNRQSRFLTSTNLDAINAKKQLQIQGFIPIIGLKDVVDDDTTTGQQSRPTESQSSMTPNRYQQQQPQDLPYAQSSIGHATFGVQRYLNTDQHHNMDLSTQASHTQTSGVLDTFKRPIRKLSGFPSTSTESNHAQTQRQNCLCVPFYICKNGYISESSLGKTQIQQMIAQQQQQQLAQLDQQQVLLAEVRQSPSLRSGTIESVPIQPPQYPAIDERSFDREVITAPSTTVFDNSQAINHTIDFSAEASLSGDLNQAAIASTVDDPAKLNASLNGNFSSDYSQEILGRMLGLGSNSKQLSAQSSPLGSCGLLRTCCQIPSHLIPSQQDLANEKLMSQYGVSTGISTHYNKYLAQPSRVNSVNIQPNSDLIAQQTMQSPHSGQISSQQSFKLPYGLPTQGLRSYAMQPLNTFSNPSDGLLAHRSTLQSAQSLPTRALQQQPNVSQYTRAVSPMQSLQSFTQPIQQQQQTSHQLYHQQLAKALTPMAPTGSARQYMSQISHQPNQQMLSQGNLQSATIGSQSQQQQQQPIGTRKILDGRCGLRNSAGITGRVQNLQYHESSADFGEYPAQAAILKRLSGSDNLFVCGGTLISQYWVATAAHCIKKHSQTDLKVRLGEWDVHRDDEFYPYVEKEIRDLIIHPEFVAGNLINDIALLRLDSPVDPSLPHVNPACLPTIDETFDRQHCTVTGWGKDSFGQKGSFQAVLREVDLPVVGHQECESALRSTRLGPHYRLHSGFICAGGEGGKDACEGDGGSGLYCMQNGVIKVAGLVSWGIGCGQAGVPGVYVNLAHYRPWIENIISIDEDIYSPYNNLISSTLISERSNGNSSNVNTNASGENQSSNADSTTKSPSSEASDP